MKKVLLTLSALTLMSSVAMAAPITDLQKGQSVAGYSYWNANVDLYSTDIGSTNANGFYVETAIDDKFTIGAETMKGSVSKYGVSIDTRFTDVSLKYKVDKNLRLIAGNRNYDTSASYSGYSASATASKFFYGVGATTELGANTSGYASVIHSSIADDYQIGVDYIMNKNVGLNVNYRSYNEDDFSLKGIEFGISCKF